MKSALIRPPFSAKAMRDAWVVPRFAPSPTTRTRKSSPSTRSVSLAGSPTCIILARGLHIGADAAETEQVRRRLQDRGDQRRRLDLGHRQAERRLDLGGQRDRSDEHTSELQ